MLHRRPDSGLGPEVVLAVFGQNRNGGGKRVCASADELEREILVHVRALARELLDEPGVSPIVGAQLIVAWSHRGGRGIAEPPGRESIHANVALP